MTDEQAEAVLDRFRELCARVDAKDPSAEDVRELRRLMSERGLWRAVAAIGQTAEAMAFGAASHLPESLRMAWEARLAGLRREVGGPEPLVLEQLMVQHLSLCWLRLNLAEVDYSAMAQRGDPPAGRALYWERRLSEAQRWFTRACESLARVRRLSRGVPAVQVNIAAEGGQQVNVVRGG